MSHNTIGFLHSYFPDLRWAVSKWWYEKLSSLDLDTNMIFMNYGYANIDPHGKQLPLETQDEDNRYCIQHYHHVATAVDLKGLDVLEICSGRGGGASYITRYLQPKSLIGYDITANAISFCNRHYSVDGLSFIRGDSRYLPFVSNAFDAIVNIEASGYPNMARFYSEVNRVLKPGGHFLNSDFRKDHEIDPWRSEIKASGLKLVKEEDITPNVVRALELDNDRKQQLINQYAPKILRKAVFEFAGVTNTNYAYGAFKARQKLYLHFVSRKPEINYSNAN